MGFAPAIGARGCADGPQSGAVDLQGRILSRFGPRGAFPLGIFNCRRIGGPDSPWSLHAEGRAIDVGIPGVSGELGDQLVGELLRSTDLALQRLLWSGECFDLVSPEGRPITSGSMHEDHVHAELSWPCARGEIVCVLPDDDDPEEDAMPVLIVAYRGAQWAVSPDLTTRVGLSQSVDVQALTRLNGGRSYVSAVLSESLMARIPPVSAL